MNKSLTTLTASVVAAAAVAGGAGVSAAAATAASPAECSVGQLAAKITAGSPGAGNRYAYVTLTNESKTGCTTEGYIGLGLESSSGKKLPTKAVRVEKSKERAIYLKPGGHTRTLLHWGAVQGTGDKRGGTCFVAPGKVLITPPNAFSSKTLKWTQGVVCEQGTIDITPLGTTTD